MTIYEIRVNGHLVRHCSMELDWMRYSKVCRELHALQDYLSEVLLMFS